MLISVVVSGLLVGAAFWFSSAGPSDTGSDGASAVSVIDGTQFVDITAKGGYAPRRVVATAGLPTVLRVGTSGTFDCSASLVIPRLSYQKFLQPSGTEDIVITSEQAQGTLQGLCSMGMYGFQIVFQ